MYKLLHKFGPSLKDKSKCMLSAKVWSVSCSVQEVESYSYLLKSL